MTILQALLKMQARIVNNETHQDYKRVCELAELYKVLISGENQDELLQKAFGHILPDELKRIKAIYQPATPAITNSLKSAFKKVFRTEPALKQIDFESKDIDGKKLTKLTKVIDAYHANMSVEDYLQKRVHDLSFSNPNAFIVNEFADFDPNNETAKSYPWEVLEEMAVNYGYINGVLDFLLTEYDITYTDSQGKQQNGKKLTIYLDNDGITFTQVDAGGASANEAKFEGDVNRPDSFVYKDKKFAIGYFEHKTGAVPAQVIGYMPDETTNGRTYVNPFHYGALYSLLGSIKTKAELDITMSKHAFPQKMVYVDRCSFDDTSGKCQTSGQLPKDCKKCGGSGLKTHESSKDIQMFERPRNKEDLLPLDSLMHYAYPPIDGIKTQMEYIDAETEKCYKGVFNSDVFNKAAISQTATEKSLEYENIYDVLAPYADKMADLYMGIIRFIGKTLDISDLIVKLKYPSDFKLKGITDLLTDLKSANDSGAPYFVKEEINNDIAQKMYSDHPTALKRYEAKQRLYPFPGKTESEITAAINLDLLRPVDKVLWAYFDNIMAELEEESNTIISYKWSKLVPDQTDAIAKAKAANMVWYFDLPYEIQKALMYAKADMKLKEIEAATPAAQPFGFNTGTQIDNNGIV